MFRFLLLFALLWSLGLVTVHAGPFGLEMGMSKEQMKKELKMTFGNGLRSTGIGRFLYKVKVPKPHSDFGDYYIIVTPEHGLCKILAVNRMTTNGYGSNVKIFYEELKKKIVRLYGRPSDEYDFLRAGSIWDEPRDWTMGLVKEERELKVLWLEVKKKTGSKIEAIKIECFGINREIVNVHLDYEFLNFDEALKVYEAREDNVF